MSADMPMGPTRRRVLAASAALITVAAGATSTSGIQITVNSSPHPITVNRGSTIEITVTNGPGNPTDWVGLFHPGDDTHNAIAWVYLASGTESVPSSGVKSGTVHLVMPTTDGQYECRFVLNNGYTPVATSPGITVALVVAWPSVTAAPSSSGLALSLQDGSGAIIETFTQNASEDIGDYVGRFVHQKCFVQHAAEWTVFFRPDADGSRDEVVVERGRFGSTNPTHILTPYYATIWKNGAVAAREYVPRHWWYARWRWQSAPRPIRRSLADIIALKALCPLDRIGIYLSEGPLRTVIPWLGPMDIGGFNIIMHSVGERPEIGTITEYQAAFLLDGNPEARQTMLTQAEAVGTMPIWARDMSGALFDVYATAGAALGTAPLSLPPYPYNPDRSYNAYLFQMDVAHLPSPSYVPWLLTDDPYFYEGLEALANWAVLFTDYHRAQQGLEGLVYPGETRAWAWGMREVFRAGAFAPVTPPSWLKPQSYWRRLAADNLRFTAQFMASPAKIHAIFREFSIANGGAPWEQAFVMSSVGWAVWSGFYPEWSTFATWFAGGLIPFVNGTSGWDRRWPSPYYVDLLNMRGGAPEFHGLCVPDTSYDAYTPDSWAEAWSLFPNWQNTPDGGYDRSQKMLNPALWTDPNKVYQNPIDNPYGVVQGAPSGPAYLIQMRAGLAFAALAGVSGARVAHDWLQAALRPVMMTGYKTAGDRKWSFDPSS